jgi:hypothetical protein
VCVGSDGFDHCTSPRLAPGPRTECLTERIDAFTQQVITGNGFVIFFSNPFEQLQMTHQLCGPARSLRSRKRAQVSTFYPEVQKAHACSKAYPHRSSRSRNTGLLEASIVSRTSVRLYGRRWTCEEQTRRVLSHFPNFRQSRRTSTASRRSHCARNVSIFIQPSRVSRLVPAEPDKRRFWCLQDHRVSAACHLLK